jgi:hypothetical protein
LHQSTIIRHHLILQWKILGLSAMIADSIASINRKEAKISRWRNWGKKWCDSRDRWKRRSSRLVGIQRSCRIRRRVLKICREVIKQMRSWLLSWLSNWKNRKILEKNRRIWSVNRNRKFRNWEIWLGFSKRILKYETSIC